MKPTALRYLLLYIPWLIAIFFASDPVASYLFAWAGSFYIFYLSFFNKVKNTSAGEPFSEKVLKPLFLMQFIFAGYLCCTSVFYFLDQMGMSMPHALQVKASTWMRSTTWPHASAIMCWDMRRLRTDFYFFTNLI